MTINEIAALAGVSKSTVSRVINGSKNVNEKTRKRILEIIKKNDYIPSAMAIGLSNKNSYTIGWILPKADNIFFGEVTQGIYEVLANTQYSLVLSCTQNEIEYELKALKIMRQQNIKGLLITTSSGYVDDECMEKINKELEALSVPVVMIDRLMKNTSWNGVYTDNYNGAYELTNALIKAGFTEIGGLFSDMKLNIGKERYRGFKQALLEHNIKEKCIILEDGPAVTHEFYEISSRIVTENKYPKAFFLSNGIVANGFFKAIIEKGIVPGKDIHCVSFDYSDALDVANIPYSYLKRNCKLLGQTAMKMLMRSFKENSVVREECIIPATLQLDESLKKACSIQ